jgi:PAS domain S-box-containing protein
MKGIISYWNGGAEELYGWTAEQAVGKSTSELLHTVFPRPSEEVELLRTGRWEESLKEEGRWHGCLVSSDGRYSVMNREVPLRLGLRMTSHSAIE